MIKSSRLKLSVSYLTSIGIKQGYFALKQIIKTILHKPIPLWMLLVILLDISISTNILQYYFMKKQLKESYTKLSQTTENEANLVSILKLAVLPPKGYMTTLTWGDLGKQLVDAGAIDKQKFEQLFNNDPDSREMMRYLDTTSDQIKISAVNSRFMLNILWALGLVNKSKVLDEGPMMQNPSQISSYASTAGWTLGTKDATKLYSTKEIIKLTSQQQDLVKKIAENVFRPCCGNPASFPDCNHGMAALGYIELAVKAGLTEKQIYKDLLAFNSYWFPQNYIEIAAYFSKQNIKWQDTDPKLILSADYSSAQGAQRIKQSVQDISRLQQSGGGCSV